MGQVRGPDRVQDAVAGFALTVRCGPAPIPQTTKSDRKKIQTMNDQYPANSQPVIVVGAGPAGCTAALLLADFGIPVTLLETPPPSAATASASSWAPPPRPG